MSFFTSFAMAKSGSDDGFISRHPLSIHLHFFFIPSDIKLSEGDKYQQVA